MGRLAIGVPVPDRFTGIVTARRATGQEVA